MDYEKEWSRRVREKLATSFNDQQIAVMTNLLLFRRPTVEEFKEMENADRVARGLPPVP